MLRRAASSLSSHTFRVASTAPLMQHPQQAVHAQSLLGRSNGAGEAFWLSASRHIDWVKAPKVAYGKSTISDAEVWFPDGTLNSCYNALDRHVLAGYGARVAFHHVSPMPPASAQPKQSMTYDEVLLEVKALAGVLKHKFGVKKGDRVVVYMPMILSTAIAMLACARIGAIHSTVFGGFAAKELAKRIDDAKPSLILAASCGIEPKSVIDYKEILDKALTFINVAAPPILMFQRSQVKGHSVPKLDESKAVFDWAKEVQAVKEANKLVEECTPVESDAPLYILYTSGTTGAPKGIVRYNGGHAVASRYSIEHTFGIARGDVIFTASDFGWVVGHSYSMYCPLFVGATSVIFEGKPILPDAGIFWKIVQDYKVNALFTAPTALRAIRREDPSSVLMNKYDLTSLRGLFLAGERSEPGIIRAYQELLTQHAATGALVVDNWWSTESGSPISACSLNRSFAPLTPRPGSAGGLLPGMDVKVVDDEGKEVKAGDLGNIVIAKPLPPSALGTVWGNPARYREAYFERFEGKGEWMDTGDAGILTEDGYISVLSRADDIINVAGHRLGTSLLEQVVSSHPYVAECCVVGLPDELKGHVPFTLVTRATSKEAQAADLDEVLKEINLQIRADVGSIATLGGLTAARLPKTRSGKTLRRTVKTLVENAAAGSPDKDAPFPPTIEDATAVDDARAAVNKWFERKKGQIKAKL